MSAVSHVEASGMEMDSDEEVEVVPLVCFWVGNGILDGDVFEPVIRAWFSWMV